MKKIGKFLAAAAAAAAGAAAVIYYYEKKKNEDLKEDDLDDFDDFDDDLDEEAADTAPNEGPVTREYVSLNKTREDQKAPAPDACQEVEITEDTKEKEEEPSEELFVDDSPSADTIAEEEAK